MKRLSEKIRPFSLALVLLMPVTIESALLAEVVPEVLVAERKEESVLDDDINQLKKEAEEAEKLQKYSKAIDLYKRILEFQEKNLDPVNPDIVYTLNLLAYLYQNQGLFSKAESLFLRALSIYEEVLGPEHPYTATTLNSLGHIYIQQGLYRKAEPLVLKALSIREKVLGPEHPDTASSLNTLAYLHNNQGLYTKAEPLVLRALSIYEKVQGPEDSSTASSLNILAYLYFKQGLYSKAEPLYQRALSIREKVLGPKHSYVATTLNSLSTIYLEQGLLNKAEPLVLRALSIYEKVLGPKHSYVANTLITLSTIYQEQKLFSKAEPLILRALSIYEKVLGPKHSYVATTLNNLAVNYNNQGLYKKAEPLYLRALSIDEKTLGPEHPYTATGLNNLALNYNNQELYKKAEPLFLRSLSINEKVLGPQHPNTVFGLFYLALNYSSQGLYEKAIPLMFQAQERSVSLIQRESPYLPLTDREAFVANFKGNYLRSFDFVSKGDSGVELALYARLNRHGLLEEIESRQAKLAKLEGPQKQIAAEVKEVIQKLASSLLKDKERGDLIKRKEDLEKKLYRILPKLKPRLVNLEEVAKSIPKNGILIEFQRYTAFDSAKSNNERGKQHYLALLLNPKGEKSAINLGASDLIDRKIQQALIASEEGLADATQLWGKVGDLVIKPLKEAIFEAETLFISPDAELNRIPFAALSSHKDDQLLGDAVNIRLLTTGRELLDLTRRSKSSKQNPLVIANPAFNLLKINQTKQEANLIASNTSQQRSGDLTTFNWDTLPGTAKEGKVIAELTNAQLLTKDKATSLAVQEKESPKILHIASHAYYLPDQEKGENPLLRSGIVLAGANHPQANPKDDGYLTALEVTKVKWQDTELVVISACESGKGDIQSGEGVYGLKRAIAVAGARSSLLSLWQVDDIATAAFMKSFYERLKAGEGRAEALAATQKEFRNHSIPGWRHPYVWAAFQLSGDWRPIDF